MSMSIALEFTRDWFRSKYGWKWNECGVQFESKPSYSAGNFYVSLDDQGVETGNDDTESLKEVITISIGIWRRSEHFMKDQLGELKMPDDKYLVGSKTLHQLERQIIIDNEPKFGLHKNWTFMQALNDAYGLPSEIHGANFVFPFTYRGRGSMVTTFTEGGNNMPITWYGYILRFRGLAREQILHQQSSFSLG